MAGIFRSIKRFFSGEELGRVETKIMGGAVKMSLSLQWDMGTGSNFFELAFSTFGNKQYITLELAEFDALVTAATDLRANAKLEENHG
jgi:hypothetical protein